ncbi:NB-ARC domains-containing protein [Tanacetum coccineum]
MATTSIPHRWKYDVFVSFRGDDVRKNFMDHLFNDFKQKGIHAFRDDRELPKGEEISPHLYKAIEESRFLIVIFSKNYASSTWCLRELVKILECKQTKDPKYEVRIIFYDAKPDVVRKQKRSYAKAFAKHGLSNRTEVDKWREALSMAANLSGWDLQDMTNGYEYKFIDFISKDMLKKLCDGPLHIGENLVGIDFHFDKLDLSRFVGSDKVNMIGICATRPDSSPTCFMIGKDSEIEDLKISSVGEGITIIKKMMSSKPILLVLDDVDDHEELEALAGSAGWFCPGSLIIFTGKDKQFLRSHRVDEIHDMDFLDEDRSLELFLSYAFKGEDYSIVFKRCFSGSCEYMVQGHPWPQSMVDKSLFSISSDMSVQMHDLIQAMARGIVREESIMPGKQIRLWNLSDVYDLLSGKKVEITEAVEVLVLLLEKSSQKVHIDAASFAHLKKLRILKIYQIDKFLQEFELKNYNVKFSGSLYFLSNELRLFCWHGCPFKYLPSNFYPENIVVIDLSYSLIKQLWTTPKCLRRLKLMKLRHCCNLTTTPDFSEITNLEELDLEGCVNLVTVHPSIGMLKRLVVLNMRDCRRARSFPSKVEMDSLQFLESIGGLSCLKHLNLNWNNLLEVPESIGGLTCLKDLYLNGNNFTSLPGSLSQLFHLRSINVDGCKKLEVLPELPPSLSIVMARDCTSLCSVTESSEYPFMTRISVESTDIFFHFPGSSVESTDIIYAGNSIPEWFTDKSMGNHVKVDLPSDWCYDKFKGFGTCVVFKRKKPCRFIGNYSIENFDGASLGDYFRDDRFEGNPIRIHESYMIWQHYEKNTRCTQRWKKAENFVTFCFEENNEDIQVKEFGVRLLYHGDLQQDFTNLIMFHLCFRKNGLAPYFGRIVGRVANTTKEGKFTFNWTDYNLPVNNGPDT